MQQTESQKLTSFESRITLPGCEIHRNGLVIDEGVTNEQLGQIKGTLRTINESGLWWWGDFLNFCEFKRGLTYDTVEDASEYSYDSLRKAKRVCGAFELCLRRHVSFTHHFDALNECQGNAEKALAWLTKAEENKWSISEMRKAIRTGEAPYGHENDKAQPNVLQWVGRIGMWFKQKPTKQAAKQLLPKLEEATARCREIAEA